jgi:hypothetical protein
VLTGPAGSWSEHERRDDVPHRLSAAWLAVAGSTATHLMRPRGMRRDISLLARAGLLIWFPGVIAATFAEVRHWPAREIGQMHAVGSTCKLTGFAL